MICKQFIVCSPGLILILHRAPSVVRKVCSEWTAWTVLTEPMWYRLLSVGSSSKRQWVYWLRLCHATISSHIMYPIHLHVHCYCLSQLCSKVLVYGIPFCMYLYGVLYSCRNWVSFHSMSTWVELLWAPSRWCGLTTETASVDSTRALLPWRSIHHRKCLYTFNI